MCLCICAAPRAQAVARPPEIDLRVPRRSLRLALSYGLMGGLAGAALGGGVVGFLSATGQAQPDWRSVLATSAGVGFALGALVGALRPAPPSALLALRPARDGLSFGDQHKGDLSGTVLLPLFGRGL